jgi:predicted membrane channel-forming protein YqfA (hemolysin III family)
MVNNGDPFVAIAGVIAGVMLVMLFFTLIFDPGQVWILMPIAGAMAILGIALGYFASKPRRFRR